jgi:hypothetical protein
MASARFLPLFGSTAKRSNQRLDIGLSRSCARRYPLRGDCVFADFRGAEHAIEQ